MWTSVKWPVIGQYLARQDHKAVRQVLRPRVWIQSLTFLALALALVSIGPLLLEWVGRGKHMLPQRWLVLLALDAFFAMQFSLWGTFLSLQNRLPYLWYTVATNAVSLLLSLSLVRLTPLGLGALVLGPLVAGAMFDYWYWPPFAARTVGTSLRGLLFRPGEASKADSGSAD